MCFDVSVQKWYCSGIQQHVCCSLHTERWRAPCLADTVICDGCGAESTGLRDCKALEHEYCIRELYLNIDNICHHKLALTVSCVLVGSCGDSGRLDKSQANLLKRYQTSLQLFNKPEVQQRALNFVLNAGQQRVACVSKAP